MSEYDAKEPTQLGLRKRFKNSMTIKSVFTQGFTRPSFNPANDLPDLTGKVAIVTGASTGLGKETARELARKGAQVFCIGRTVEKTKAAIDEIIKETGNDKVSFIHGDFMDLNSVCLKYLIIG